MPRPSYPLFESPGAARRWSTVRSYDLEYHGAVVDRHRERRARADAQDPRAARRQPEQPDRVVRQRATSSTGSPASVRARGARDHRRRGVRRLRARAGRRGSRGRASLDRDDVLVFSLGGLSKSVGLPQVKLGWIAVAGPPALVAEALARLELICDTYLSVSTPVQVAARRAARSRRRRVRRSDCGTRGGELRPAASGRASAPACRVLRRAKAAGTRSSGCRRLQPEEDLVLDLLTTDGVLAHPGYFSTSRASPIWSSACSPPEAVFAAGIARDRCGTSIAERRTTHEPIVPAGAAPACSFRCFRVRRPRAGASARSAISRRSTAWLAGAGQRVLQLLPLNEMAPGQQSPYSAISAMAIDPIFIRVPAVPEFAALGGEASLSARRSRTRSTRCGGRRAIDYATVRALKQPALRAAFERFRRSRVAPRHARAPGSCGRFVSEQAWWIDDYALFRAIHAREDERPWTEWPERASAPRAGGARSTRAASSSHEVLFHQYLQWLADSQWQDGAQRGRTACSCSAICRSWSTATAPTCGRGSSSSCSTSRSACRPTRSAPPGQDWGMPVYRWDVIGARGLPLAARSRAAQRRSLRRLPRRSSRRLLPHVRPAATTAVSRSSPRPTSRRRLALGEQRARHLPRSRAPRSSPRISAPCPTSCARRSRGSACPASACSGGSGTGTREGQPFRDPADYPPRRWRHPAPTTPSRWPSGGSRRLARTSAAKVSELPTIQRLARGARSCDAPYDATVRDVLLEALFASGSNLLLLPMQDVFGWRDRINEPATVTDGNWTFRLPWPGDRLADEPQARERQHTLRDWSAAHHRL